MNSHHCTSHGLFHTHCMYLQWLSSVECNTLHLEIIFIGVSKSQVRNTSVIKMCHQPIVTAEMFWHFGWGHLGKHLSGWCHLYLGIAQIAITPPPHTQTGTLGHFFQARFHHFTIFTIFFLPFSLNKWPKPSGQGFRPPQNQANARLNLENSSLKKCPKPSGQGFRPPKIKQMPVWTWKILL